jgi:hypothetical protein
LEAIGTDFWKNEILLADCMLVEKFPAMLELFPVELVGDKLLHQIA